MVDNNNYYPQDRRSTSTSTSATALATEATLLEAKALLEDIKTNTNPGSGGLTDTELRASPVPVTDSALATVITALGALLTELQLKADLTDTQPVSLASVPLPTGSATAANQITEIAGLAAILAELGQKADLTDTQPVSAASLPLPTGAATEATLASIKTAVELIDNAISGAGFNITQLNGVTIAMNSGNTSTGTQRIVIATDQPTVPTEDKRYATSTLANVSSSATNVTLIASNANRRMAMLYNDSSAICYVKFGATASATSFTVRMEAFSYFEVPYPGYTGIIDGIWTSATGSMRTTEIT